MKKNAPSMMHAMLMLLFLSVQFAFAGNSVLNTGDWYKFSAKETGIYILTYSDLQAIGIPVSAIDPRMIGLYGNGPGELPTANNAPRANDLQEIAIEIKGEADGVFDPNDTIFFYNHEQTTWKPTVWGDRFVHSKNHYSDSTSFFLTIKTSLGKRISPLASLPNFNDSVSIYTNYAVHDVDSINLIHSGGEWYGEYFDVNNYSARSFPILVQNILNNDSVRVYLKFAGRSLVTSNSQVGIELNGYNVNNTFSQVGSSPQDNYANAFIRNQWTYAPVVNGQMNITFQSPDPNAICWLDYYEMNALSNLVFTSPQMSFRNNRHIAPGRILKYKMITNSNLRIWDVTKFNDVKEQLFTTSLPSVTFNAVLDSLHEYLAFDGSQYTHPVYNGSVLNQNLHSIGQKNMIIICDPEFISQANTLAAFHQTHDNLSTVVVSSDQVYNEYSSGQQDPVAIRDFVRQIYFSASSANDSLKYLLLFGNASYDYRNILGQGRTTIPTYESENSLNPVSTYCSDDFYALMDSMEGQFATQDLADIAVGRIPARNQQEASVVNKIISYSSNPNFNPWRSKVVGVGDDEDFNIHIKQEDTLMNRIENYECGLDIEKIYIDEYVQHYDSVTNLYSFPDARNEIERQFINGCALIQFTGHESINGIQGWATENIIDKTFTDSVNNISTLPVVISSSAVQNLIDDPQIESFGRSLVFNLNGGGIASVGPTRLAFSSSNHNFAMRLNSHLFEFENSQRLTLGEIFKRTKRDTYLDPYIRSISLMGDPAIKISFPVHQVETTFISSDTISSWQQVQIDGEIQDRTGVLQSGFNGNVDVVIYKQKTKHTTLGNDSGLVVGADYPMDFFEWDDTLYAQNVTVVNGFFSLNFIVPALIDSGFSIGKIAYYAEDGMTDANGCYQNIILKNLTPGIPEYPGLEVKLYPVPAKEFVNCSISGQQVTGWGYELRGADGKVLLRNKIISNQFILSRASLASGIYLLKILDESGRIRYVKKIIFE